MRWTSQAVLVAVTTKKVFGGSAWTTLIHQDKLLHSAFALWANSTLGLMAHWSQASRQHLGRARTQVRAIQTIPCPDFTRLPTKVLREAQDIMSQISRKRLLLACHAHQDRVRHQIDAAAVYLLAPNAETARAMIQALSELRLAWCRKPSVHGYNLVAMQALEKRYDRFI